MEETKLVEAILEIASELDRGDITFDEAQIKTENLVRIDKYEQLSIAVVVGQSEQLPKNNCTLNRQTCGKGSGCKYPHCHL